MAQLYETIGTHYAKYRRPDPRIAAAVTAAIGNGRRIVNVGAGAGSYEPKDRDLIAVEPSETMIRQRRADAAPVVRASAASLPFRDEAFDAALAILTIHHWPDQRAGLSEMARVARRCVLLTWEEPSASSSWLTHDYFPEILAYDRTVFSTRVVILRQAVEEGSRSPRLDPTRLHGWIPRSVLAAPARVFRFTGTARDLELRAPGRCGVRINSIAPRP